MRRWVIQHVDLTAKAAADAVDRFDQVPDCMLELNAEATVQAVYGNAALTSFLTPLKEKNLFVDLFPVFNTDEILSDFAAHAHIGNANLLLEYRGGPWHWVRLRIIQKPSGGHGLITSLTRRTHEQASNPDSGSSLTDSVIMQAMNQRIA